MNVVIPMAGYGSRMKEAGYENSKPMIDVIDRKMIEVVVDNLALEDVFYHFIVRQEDSDIYDLTEFLPTIIPESCEAKVHCIDGVSEGAACSVLTIEHLIDNETPLVVVNSDQEIIWGDNPWEIEDEDGVIFTFKASGNKYSYAKSEDGLVTEVAEKVQISDDATAGAYYWRKGSFFVEAAKEMINKDITTNGEFYVAPVYNEMLDKKVVIRPVNDVYHLGTPEELQAYVSNKLRISGNNELL